MRRVRVAVDAGNLVRDRRGLGRVTRGVLAAAHADGAFEIALLCDRRADARELAREFPALPIAKTATAAKSGAYDLVWFPFNGIRYRTAAPAIVTIADAFAFTRPHPQRVARAREQGPIRRAARDAARILTISQWSAREIERELAVAAKKIAVVPLAPDTFWLPKPNEALPDGVAGKRFALVVGVREARKNVRLALEAFALAQRAADEILVIAGELSPDDLTFARSTGVRAGQILPGDALLRALYSSAAAVLVPSTAEGFGLVAAEALACGAVVIASDASAIPEATGDAAILLDPADVSGWTRAIRDVFDDAELATTLRTRALAAYPMEARLAPARKTLALFRQTVAS